MFCCSNLEQAVDVGVLAGVGFGVSGVFSVDVQTKRSGFGGDAAEFAGEPDVDAQGAGLAGFVFDACDRCAGSVEQFNCSQSIDDGELGEVVGEGGGEGGLRGHVESFVGDLSGSTVGLRTLRVERKVLG